MPGGRPSKYHQPTHCRIAQSLASRGYTDDIDDYEDPEDPEDLENGEIYDYEVKSSIMIVSQWGLDKFNMYDLIN